ncbi:MAG TPA: type II CAAX endopeptidase family protein [Conexibacter sp.]|nr:type II CAAX endopeptidase family protein [Conexibacter sp.]
MSSASSYGSWLPPATDPAHAPEPPTAARWAPWTAWVALLAAFGIAILGAIVVGIVGAIFGASFDDPPPAVNIVATFIQDGAFIGAALLFASRAGTVLPAQFGLSRVRLRTALKWTAIAYVGYWLLAIAWAALIGIDEQDSLPDSLGVDESTVALVAVCVLVTVVAPIAEEVFFRGYFFGALRNWRGPWPAALITGLVFGGIHAGSAEPEFLVPLAILGVALCVLRWKTGSLLPCIALHAVNNALAFSVAEDWTVGQGALLVVGATSVALLACRPFLGPRQQRA